MSQLVIHRSKPQGFVQIPNALARDKVLSFTARGLILELLSHVSGWEVGITEIAVQKRSGRRGDGREAVLAAYGELKACGYVIEEESSSGVLVAIHVYDTPQTEKPSSASNTANRIGGPPGETAYNGRSAPNTVSRIGERPAETAHTPSSPPDTASRIGESPGETQQTPTSFPNTASRIPLRTPEREDQKEKNKEHSVSFADPGPAKLAERDRTPSRRQRLTKQLAELSREELEEFADQAEADRGSLWDWAIKSAAKKQGVEYQPDAEFTSLTDEHLQHALLRTVLRLERSGEAGVPESWKCWIW